jgi:hypothetical protein
LQKARVEIPKEASRHFWFSRVIEHSLRPWTSCILWSPSGAFGKAPKIGISTIGCGKAMEIIV